MYFNYIPSFAYMPVPSFPMFGAATPVMLAYTNPFLNFTKSLPIFSGQNNVYPTYQPAYYNFTPTYQSSEMPVMELFKNNQNNNTTSNTNKFKLNTNFSFTPQTKPVIRDYAAEFKRKTANITNEVQRALMLARQEYRNGAKENGNSNDSIDVRKYKNGAKNNNPWCAYFSSWLYGRGQNSSNNNTFGYTASSQEIMRQANAKGHFAHKNSGYVPKPGDLAIWTKSSNKDQGHVGIVDEVTSNGYYVIEGNSSNKVARNFYSFNNRDISSNLKFSGFAKMSEWTA